MSDPFLIRALAVPGRAICPACKGAARSEPIRCRTCSGLGWVQMPGYRGPEGYDVDVLP